jgi:hypothetical protein
MCGGAIIFDYIPARRRVSAADFWPDSEADAEDSDSHAPDPERGKLSQWCVCVVLRSLFIFSRRARSLRLQTVSGVCVCD